MVILLGAAMLAVAGASPVHNAFTMWPADPLLKIMPDSKPPENRDKSIRIDAVINEHESAQLVVTAGDRIDKLTVAVHPLAGPSRLAPSVRAEFVGFVPVQKGTSDTPPEHLIAAPPMRVPDPLLAVRSVCVESGTNQPIWLTVYVPKGCAPGTYSGSVEAVADGFSESVPLIVHVLPVMLPDDRNLQLTNWFWPDKLAAAQNLEKWSEPFWKVLEAYARLMADHRQNVVLTPILELIDRRDAGAGGVTFDFSRFDRWVELFRRAGVIGTIEGGHLGGRTDWEAEDFDAYTGGVTPDYSHTPDRRVKVTSEEYRQFLSEFFPALQKHLDEKRWTDIYLQHLCDEPISANADSYRKLAAHVRRYAPRIRIIEACMCSELVGAIDVWVPQPPHYEKDIDFFRRRQKAGDDVWFYTCLSPKGKYMNRFLDYPLLDVRLLHWANFKYGLTGYLHWGFNFWVGDPFRETEAGIAGVGALPPGDTHMIYPGRRGPLSSIRLEAMRDGIEDFELLRLLQEKDTRAAKRICDSVVRSFTDYSLDPVALRAARLRLIKELSNDR